ncbi:MAG: sodium:alanine symporter family protein [Oscillospiraceae bacterium]|nr:sodium:alanine symporter family protein [Oscillospiraceae bacterium]
MLARLSDLVWGPWTLALFLLVGGYYSVRTGFFQFFGLPRWLGGTLGALFRRKKRKPGELSPLQILSTSLGAMIGTGSIVGVATAITLGGPGAVFWMWISALLGMMTAFAEKTLALARREPRPGGGWKGGPMLWLDQLGLPGLGKCFAFCCILTSLGMCGLAQSNSMAAGLEAAFGWPPLAVGIAAAALVGISLVGGVDRIGQVCEKLVPVMTLLFFAGSLYVLFCRREQIPAALHLIVQDAFGVSAVTGGGVGAAIRYGVARGVFNSEAGLGTTALIHASSASRDPVEEGFWGMFEVFLDGIVLCAIMALIILTSGVWEAGSALDGAALCCAAFEAVMGPAGTPFVAVCLALFALSALLGGSYYGQCGVEHLWHGRGGKAYIALFLLAVAAGSVSDLRLVWQFADLCNALLALPNLTALLLLSPVVLRCFRGRMGLDEMRI